MIKLQEVEREIKDILDLPNQEGVKETELNKARKKIQFLTVMKNYLLESPTIEFLEKELDRLNGRFMKIQGQYPDLPNADRETQQAAIKQFEKEMGIPLVKLQIKSLKYLLKK